MLEWKMLLPDVVVRSQPGVNNRPEIMTGNYVINSQYLLFNVGL
jgi:hypothetical protein